MPVLSLPPVDRPLLSVVMVTYGGWDWPRRALEALRRHTDPVYEVAVVDNASPDETAKRLRAEVRGAKLVFNDRNLGFATAANQGAAEAMGWYLCFLNPDALVQPGWLSPLVETLQAVPRAGAVVPRFLAPDGTVDEAGSLVDREARTLAYGRGGDASDPQFRFRRVIDYGSAACLVMPAWAFRRAGGFDPVFHPAYCEDVDLLLTLGALGLRTVYDPRSTVIHAGAGSTDDVVRGGLIERNRPILLARWADALSDRPSLLDLSDHQHRVVAVRDASTTDRLLLSTEDDGSGPLESLAGRLADARPDLRVTLLRVARGKGSPSGPGDEELLARGVEAIAPADPAGWLEDRRLHYTAAILDGPRVAARLEPSLRRSQPGILRAYVAADRGDGDPAHPRGATGWRSSEVSAMRTASAVLCRSEGGRRTAGIIAPAVPTFPLGELGEATEVLSLLGIAPA
ncbi:MAG TPA: glycosyltransferase family 2 protein [Actinomycetota bacterium]|jgi:GT2 family glycosyltransferase|nr:glycosyltransferase family 2 protein [Actinomycetota bacterium]